MMHSIRSSVAPSRALLLAACLIAPQAIHSKKVVSLDDAAAFVPGINSLIDATSKRHLSRSLQLDSIVADIIDDDAVLDFFSEIDMDDNLVQCLEETEDFYEAKNLQDEVDAFENGVVLSTTMENNLESISVNLEYPEANSQILRQECTSAGGYFQMVTGDITCSLDDPTLGVTMVTTISGLATCVANTESCTSDSMLSVDFLITTMEALGSTCEMTGTVKGTSAALDSAAGTNAPRYATLGGMLVASIGLVLGL